MGLDLENRRGLVSGELSGSATTMSAAEVDRSRPRQSGRAGLDEALDIARKRARMNEPSESTHRRYRTDQDGPRVSKACRSDEG